MKDREGKKAMCKSELEAIRGDWDSGRTVRYDEAGWLIVSLLSDILNELRNKK